MTIRIRPNAWTTKTADDSTVLTYAPLIDPAPLTVSLSDQNPTYASLQIVITNPTKKDIVVTSIIFQIAVGPSGLTPTTAGIKTAVSDKNKWLLQLAAEGDQLPADAKANFILGPATGASVILAAHTSVVVEIYHIKANTTPGTSAVFIAEEFAGTAGGTGSFRVTTFPYGFFFDSLTANIEAGSALVPIAQVDLNKQVVLTWNGSVVIMSGYTILVSSATSGQQTFTPTIPGEWTSPKLTSDTVFTVVASATTFAGAPLTASMSIAVAVRNPMLIATSLDTTGAGGSIESGVVKATRLTGQSLTIPPDQAATTNLLRVAKGSASYLAIHDGGKIEIAGASIENGVVTAASLTGQSLTIPPGQAVTTDLLRVGKGLKSYLTIQDGGNVGIGATPPADPLDVAGHVRVMSGGNPIRFTSGWSNFPGEQTNRAEISNDTTSSKSLMIAGNRSDDATTRKVSIWDQLYVNGTVTAGAFKAPYVEVNGTVMVYGKSRVYGSRFEAGWQGLPNFWANADGIVRAAAYWYSGDVSQPLYKLTAGPAGKGDKRSEHYRPDANFSDDRLRTDVRPISDALGKITQLQGVLFRWNEAGVDHFNSDIPERVMAGHDATPQENQKVWDAERKRACESLAGEKVGLAVQDVEGVMPQLLHLDQAGYRHIQYQQVIALLVEAVKEQNAAIQKLSERLSAIDAAAR